MAWWLWLSLAWADDLVTFELLKLGETGVSTPRFIAHAQGAATVRARITCGEVVVQVERALVAGQAAELPLTGLPDGQHACRAEVSVEGADGATGEASMAFEVLQARPLRLSATEADYDRAGSAVLVHVTRPIRAMSARVLGPGGGVVAEVTGSPVDDGAWRLAWDAGGVEVVRLDVTASDGWGKSVDLTLSPWYVSVPHDDVVFASGQHTIDPAEEPKLQRAWDELAKAVALYGAVVDVRLYVAGYTDTVGDAASNQALSERRARAIAGWFRARGFAGPVFYQGFGERALAVATPDETDAADNRRALYLLAADAPGRTPDLPASAWKPL